jgi:hypothetical protein
VPIRLYLQINHVSIFELPLLSPPINIFLDPVLSLGQVFFNNLGSLLPILENFLGFFTNMAR